MPFRQFVVVGCAVLSVVVIRSASAQPVDRPLITFDRYHTVEEFEAFLEAAVSRYPKLTKLVEIGKSRAGRRILALEINNPDTGPAAQKPAFYNDGNIHGGELSGGEAALYLINHLLTQYGRDSKITDLIDTYAFYNVPLVNPDGRAVSTTTPKNNRWNIRPTDEDGDGQLDEDGPEDIDGDGRILQMRIKDPDGRWIISPDDPRSMVRRRRNQSGGTAYNVITEGIDNDGDGEVNEDGPGGIDLNRNFPANWHSGQFASGPFPLSEPETHALVKYITSRPNIAAIHTYHTSGGMILRFPTLADQDWDFPQSDLDDYRVIGEDGVAHTGYDNYALGKKVIVDRMNPGHGVFNDWASKVFGVLAITTEMWKRSRDHNEAARLRYNDEVLQGRGFVDWHPFDHPQLGAVEIGGWVRWIANSPPEPFLEAELERNNRWVLTFAEKLPRVAILDFTVVEADSSGSFNITATVANVGWMPTATAQASEVLKIAKPVQVTIELTNAELTDGRARHSLGVLPGAREDGPARKPLHWQVRVLDSSQVAEARITVISEKAGVTRKGLRLPGSQQHASPQLPGDDERIVELVRQALWGTEADQGGALNELRRLDRDSAALKKVEAAIRAGRRYLPIDAEREDIEVTLAPGLTTTLYVQLPPNYDPTRSYPFMLAIGGGPVGSERAAIRGAERMLGLWSEAAEQADWFVAAIVDTASISTSRSPLRYHVLYDTHARAIFDAVMQRYHVDPNRLHSTGVSLGSNYSLAYAESHPDWLAGVVPVSTEGESREHAIRNVNQVGVYVLEGVNDRNIRMIEGPRKLAQILQSFNYNFVYDEHSDRGHESFKEEYPQVLQWLQERPRNPFPREVIRVAHSGIMMPDRRFYWLEADTHQAMFHATVKGQTIDIQAARASRLTLHLSDRLIDLDGPVTIRVNSQVMFEGKLDRSIITAIEDTRDLNDTQRFATARVSVNVPDLTKGEAWVRSLRPTVTPGTLAFWEMYAVQTLQEERAVLPATIEPLGRELSPGITGMKVIATREGSPLQTGDVITAFDGEPFFTGADGAAFLRSYMLRSRHETIKLTITRGGEERTVTLDLISRVER